MNKRPILVLVVIGLVFGLVVAKSMALQTDEVESQRLAREADNRHLRTVEILAPRGSIYDRHGSLLALSTRVYDVILDPKVVLARHDAYQQVLKAINLTDGELQALAKTQRNKKRSFIKYLDSPEVAEKIRAMDLDGFSVQRVNIEWQTKQGLPLKVNDQRDSLWVNWSRVQRYHQVIGDLAKTLGINSTALMKKVRQRAKRRFMYVAYQVKPDVAEALRNQHLYGVEYRATYKRFYPAGETTANLIGFVTKDVKYYSGLERAYNPHLSGQNGKQQIVRNAQGDVVDLVEVFQRAIPGKDVSLSIDLGIQYYTYKVLKEQVSYHDAESAAAIVLDAKTGEILSMVSLPSFNPNDVMQRTGPGIRNRVASDLIEPGSTMKPFTIAKGLEKGVITPDTIIDTGNGIWSVQGQLVKDTSAHREIDVKTVIQKSSNVGTAKIALMIPPEEYFQSLINLGITDYSNLYLPSEAVGFIQGQEHWQQYNQAWTSYGYSLNMSLLELARAYTVFSNDGNLLPLSLLKLNAPPEGKPVLDAKAVNQTLQMMEAVTQRGGTAPEAAIPGYKVAGKTGTVHLLKKSGGYEQNSYMSIFASLVPATNPDMIMVVAVNRPSRGVYYGGKIAAPVFQKVMQQALRIRKVAPDFDPEEEKKLAARLQDLQQVRSY